MTAFFFCCAPRESHIEMNGTLFDWFALFYCGAAAAFLLLYTAAAARVSKRDVFHVRAKQPHLIALMAAAGVVHVVATFVCNEHFPWTRAAERRSCVAWNYWSVYVAGLCPWFAGMFTRLVVYVGIFSASVSDTWVKRVRRRKGLFAAIVFVGPLASVCLIFTATGASRFDPGRGLCVSTLAFKLSVLAWILAAFFLLCALGAAVRWGIQHDYFNEFDPLMETLVLGGFVLAANATVVLTDSAEIPVLRAMVATNIATLHVFTLVRIGGWTLMRRLIRIGARPPAYTRVRAKDRAESVPLTSITETPTEEVLEEFLARCQDIEEAPITVYNTVDRQTVEVPPARFVRCYRHIQAWKLEYDDSTCEAKHNLELARFEVAKQYLFDGAADYVAPPSQELTHVTTEPLHPDVFDPILKWIVRTLDRAYGRDFLRDVERGEDGGVKDAIVDGGNEKACKRMAEFQIVDPSSDESE